MHKTVESYAVYSTHNKLFIFKDHPLVVVITVTANNRPYAHPQVDKIMERYLLPAGIKRANGHSVSHNGTGVCPANLFGKKLRVTGPCPTKAFCPTGRDVAQQFLAMCVAAHTTPRA